MHFPFSNLETIIRHQRKQYLGSIPIVVEESVNCNLQQVLKDKQKTLASLRNAQKNESGSVVLKEQLTKELQLANEYKETLGLGLEEAVSKISRWHKERSVLQVKVGNTQPFVFTAWDKQLICRN